MNIKNSQSNCSTLYHLGRLAIKAQTSNNSIVVISLPVPEGKVSKISIAENRMSNTHVGYQKVPIVT